MSLLVFIIISFLIGMAAGLFFEKDALFSKRYILTSVAFGTLAGFLVNLMIQGITQYGNLTNAGIVVTVIVSLACVMLLKATAPALNEKTDADLPWDAVGGGGSSGGDHPANEDKSEDEKREQEKKQKKKASLDEEEVEQVERGEYENPDDENETYSKS